VNSGSEHENSTLSGWDLWLAEHGAALLLYARQQVRSPGDAEDLLQEAVVETWQQQADRSPPPLWQVYATLRRRAIDLARRNERRARRELASADGSEAAWFDPAPEDRERAHLIEEALRCLPHMHQEVLTLKVWGGLTLAEIGQVLGIPANTAASRYRSALMDLRKLTRELLV